MELLGTWRKFKRRHDGIVAWFDLDEWPSKDLPLPPGVKLMNTGEGPFRPNWHIVLEQNFTGEIVGGWFVLPMSLVGALEWYETEMTKRGWVKSQEYRLNEKAGIHFEQDEPRIHVELSFLDRPDLDDSTVMIRCYVKYPWSPPKSNSARANTPKRKPKPRAKPKPRKRTLAKRAVAKRTVAAAKRKV